MSYSECDGQVILTMSRDDYQKLLIELGGAMFLHVKDGDGGADEAFRWLNRLNQGNPDYTPYSVKAET